jgi:hypothetical protein
MYERDTMTEKTVGRPGTMPTPLARGGISPNVVAEISKLGSEKAARMRASVARAKADAGASDPRGPDYPMPAATAGKVSPSRTVTRPAATMPMGSAKPVDTWPAPTRSKLSSGLAKRGVLGSMPSHKAPPR